MPLKTHNLQYIIELEPTKHWPLLKNRVKRLYSISHKRRGGYATGTVDYLIRYRPVIIPRGPHAK